MISSVLGHLEFPRQVDPSRGYSFVITGGYFNSLSALDRLEYLDAEQDGFSANYLRRYAEFFCHDVQSVPPYRRKCDGRGLRIMAAKFLGFHGVFSRCAHAIMASSFMQMKFLDAHTHVQLPAYDADREQVIARARDAGVRMVNIGTQASTSRAAVELAEKHDDMWAAIGFHPSHCNESWHHDPDEQSSPEREVFDAEVFKKLAAHPKVVAIGECGLDYYRIAEAELPTTAARQKEVFAAQIDIAREAGKPLMIHCRDAFPDLIAMLRASRLPVDSPGIIHFFTGTAHEAKQLLAMGFAFTFGGATTFPPRKGATRGAYDDVIEMLPPDAILSETDAPYVAPASHRGERNEPAYVVEVIERLAVLKQLSVDDMAARINANAQRVFGIEEV